MAGKQNTSQPIPPRDHPAFRRARKQLYKTLANTMNATDSTRRSGRATKGQHSKKEEVEEGPAPVKKGKGKKKVEEEPEEVEEVIRCICGDTEEDESERVMVACDLCSAWQHNECMEVPDVIPEDDTYYCEQCRPDKHKALLAKIARGEKPWGRASKTARAGRGRGQQAKRQRQEGQEGWKTKCGKKRSGD